MSAVSVSMQLREALLREHSELTEATRPFVTRGGKSCVRFDRIEITASGDVGAIFASYSWRGTPVFQQRIADLPTTVSDEELARTIVLTGFTGETEITIV